MNRKAKREGSAARKIRPASGSIAGRKTPGRPRIPVHLVPSGKTTRQESPRQKPKPDSTAEKM